jgi:hypothetical protein
MSSYRSLAVLAGFVAGCVATFTLVLVLGAKKVKKGDSHQI